MVRKRISSKKKDSDKKTLNTEKKSVVNEGPEPNFFSKESAVSEEKASSVTDVTEEKASSDSSESEGKISSNSNEEKVIDKSVKVRQNKQLIGIVALMIIILLLFFIVPYTVKNYMNSFDYNGLKFQKTQQGQITYYSTYVPLANKNLEVVGQYPLNLRDDPRKLDDIKTDIAGENLTFIGNSVVYITIDSFAPRCTYNAIAAAGLGSFLNGFAGFKVQGALDNETYAKKNKLLYITCENSTKNTVIYLKSSNKTEIKKVRASCYELDYKECDILPVSEKFQLMILENYMEYFKK